MSPGSTLRKFFSFTKTSFAFDVVVVSYPIFDTRLCCVRLHDLLVVEFFRGWNLILWTLTNGIDLALGMAYNLWYGQGLMA